MEQTYKYRVYPSQEMARKARRHIDICRQVYNHALGQYRTAPEGNKPTYTDLQNQLPAWKERWHSWRAVYSKCLQMAVRRLFNSRKALRRLKANGYDVGGLNWKSPSEYRSIVYNQSGFDVDSNTGRTNHAILQLSKIGDIDVRYHRPLPKDVEIKQVILKEEKSGTWHASIVVDTDSLRTAKPDIDEIELEDTVGIDVGISKLTHDSDGRAITPIEESSSWRRIEQQHREVSRKEYGSNNWEKARQRLASIYEQVQRKREDLQEKLASWYTSRYDAVFLEDIHVREMLERNRNGKRVASMSWRKLIGTFQRHGMKNGCHVITVPPEGTTKQCAECGVETDKPLWVREHACPACGFEANRDQNAAMVIQRRGLEDLGINPVNDKSLGMGDAEGTPVETVLPTDTDVNRRFTEVSAKHVIETGSPVRQPTG